MFDDNPLADYPQLRKRLYLSCWILNGLMGTAGVVLVVLGLSPLAFIAVTTGFNFASAYILSVSGRNVTPVVDEQLDGHPGDDLVLDEEDEQLAGGGGASGGLVAPGGGGASGGAAIAGEIVTDVAPDQDSTKELDR